MKARDGLKRLADLEPERAEVWDLLSQVEAALLNYNSAIHSLERVAALSGKRDKRLLKRLAGLRQAHAEWSDLPLSPMQTAALGKYLEACGVDSQSETLELTRRWLEEEQSVDADRVIEAFERRGAFSDFQVLNNIVSG
jgi:hypothetical protein